MRRVTVRTGDTAIVRQSASYVILQMKSDIKEDAEILKRKRITQTAITQSELFNFVINNAIRLTATETMKASRDHREMSWHSFWHCD